MTIFIYIIAALIAYLIGSVSSAIIVCKLLNLPDPRTQGSKNPGATNVLRIGGKKAAIITLLGDALKGLLPVLVAKCLGMNSIGLSLVALAAFIGHLYPVFFQFKGGKGVATAFGCFIGLNYIFGFSLVLVWLIVAVIFRYSSLAALTMAVCAPIFAYVFMNVEIALVVLLMSVILIYRHQSNIKNLIAGKESKIGNKS